MALNVLVVDDSAVMRAILIRSLRLTGIALGDVHESANGKEALEALDQHWIDLALIDINMPVMNGEELMERVRARPETVDLPILVVSTEGNEARVRRLMQHGARFVRKPFTPERLRHEIVELTGAGEHESTDGSTRFSGDFDF